ncbi:hypothetical protein MBLNU230_g1462t1 [Neophaeotheca triangularis]
MADAWDLNDDELLSNWDRVQNEYKTYHSLSSKGITQITPDLQARIEANPLQNLPNGNPDPVTSTQPPPSPPSATAAQVPSTAQQPVQTFIGPAIPDDYVRPQQAEAEAEAEAEADAVAGAATNSAEPAASLPRQRQQQQQQQQTQPQAAAMPPLPEAVLNNTNSPNLKNLIMSWYYAGYYTGLHEGQQQQQQQQQQRQG